MESEYQPILKDYIEDAELRFDDVDKRIIDAMIKVHKSGLFAGWEEFRKYCMELTPNTMSQEEMIFLVPVCTIDRCIEKAKKYCNPQIEETEEEKAANILMS